MCQSAGKTSKEEIYMTLLTFAIESEGSIQLAWGKRKDGYIQIVPRVNLTNKDSEYIEKSILISQENGFSGHVFNHVSPGCKVLTWYGYKRVKRLLEAIKNNLLTRKRTIAETVLEFINYRLSLNPHVKYGEKEKGLFLKVRELNGKGMIHNQMLKCRFEQPVIVKKRNCKMCGEIFEYERNNHVYCSKKCVHKSSRFLEESSETICQTAKAEDIVRSA